MIPDRTKCELKPLNVRQTVVEFENTTIESKLKARICSYAICVEPFEICMKPPVLRNSQYVDGRNMERRILKIRPLTYGLLKHIVMLINPHRRERAGITRM